MHELPADNKREHGLQYVFLVEVPVKCPLQLNKR